MLCRERTTLCWSARFPFLPIACRPNSWFGTVTLALYLQILTSTYTQHSIQGAWVCICKVCNFNSCEQVRYLMIDIDLQQGSSVACTFLAKHACTKKSTRVKWCLLWLMSESSYCIQCRVFLLMVCVSMHGFTAVFHCDCTFGQSLVWSWSIATVRYINLSVHQAMLCWTWLGSMRFLSDPSPPECHGPYLQAPCANIQWRSFRVWGSVWHISIFCVCPAALYLTVGWHRKPRLQYPSDTWYDQKITLRKLVWGALFAGFTYLRGHRRISVFMFCYSNSSSASKNLSELCNAVFCNSRALERTAVFSWPLVWFCWRTYTLSMTARELFLRFGQHVNLFCYYWYELYVV